MIFISHYRLSRFDSLAPSTNAEGAGRIGQQRARVAHRKLVHSCSCVQASSTRSPHGSSLRSSLKDSARARVRPARRRLAAQSGESCKPKALASAATQSLATPVGCFPSESPRAQI